MTFNELAIISSPLLQQELLRRAIARTDHLIRLQEEALHNLCKKRMRQRAEMVRLGSAPSTINSPTINQP